jgi:hypothetical protein
VPRILEFLGTISTHALCVLQPTGRLGWHHPFLRGGLGLADNDDFVVLMGWLIRRLEEVEQLGHGTGSENLAQIAHNGLITSSKRLACSLRTALSENVTDTAALVGIAEHLGLTLICAFGITSRLDDLEEAPDHSRFALENTPVESPHYLCRLLQLVECLRQRYISLTHPDDLEECISCGREAVRLTDTYSEIYPKSILHLVEVLGHQILMKLKVSPFLSLMARARREILQWHIGNLLLFMI